MADSKVDVTEGQESGQETPDVNTGEQPETPASNPPAEANEAGTATDVADEVDDADLPSWARRSLKKANEEAASYRKQLRDAQEQLANAKTAEEHEQAIADMNKKFAEAEEARAAAERELIAARHGIPEDMTEFIVGDNADAWKASAEKLAERINATRSSGYRPAPVGRGGKPAASADSFDPKAVAAKRFQYRV